MHSVTAETRLVACDPTQDIADFVRGFSIEATRPTTEEIAVLSAVAPKGTRVYLSAVPTRPIQEALDSAIVLKAAAFNPVFPKRVYSIVVFLGSLPGAATPERVTRTVADRGPLRSMGFR